MSQGFLYSQGLTIPLPVSQGGTGATTSSGALSNLGVPNPNVIIGGNFDTNPWQRGTSFTGLTNTAIYTADRFNYFCSGGGVVSVLKTADAPSVIQAGQLVNNCLQVDVTTADASISAAEYYSLRYAIEGYDFSRIAQIPFTISFWHKHTKTGIYSIGLENSSSATCYVAEYVQDVSEAWELATITISASPSAGTWNYTNGIGLVIWFNIAMGSDRTTATLGAWQAGNLFASTNQVNAMDNVANNFKIALVKVEPGSVATPYVFEAATDVLSRCQRYYWKTFSQGIAPATAAGLDGSLSWVPEAAATTVPFTVVFPTVMRTTPSLTFYNPVTASAQVRDVSSGVDATGTALWRAGDSNFSIVYNAPFVNSASAIHAAANAEL